MRHQRHRQTDLVPSQAAFGTSHDGHHGMQPWKQLPKYDTYKSKFGPNYKIAPNFHGISLSRAAGLYVDPPSPPSTYHTYLDLHLSVALPMPPSLHRHYTASSIGQLSQKPSR